jgi:methylthioribose-1-phosphate isomerase
MNLKAIEFSNDTLRIVDQTLLPNSLKLITIDSLNKSIEAIKMLRVRGAPAIGIVAAYTLFLESKKLLLKNELDDLAFGKICVMLKDSRPTAVNLAWAINKISDCYSRHKNSAENVLLNSLRACAVLIHQNDEKSCDLIGSFGAELFTEYKNILTHCNAGILATGGNGTALSVIYQTAKKNSGIHVYVDETRPLGQGARLTYYELSENNIDCTLLTDNSAGSLFATGKIDAVIVGADRIAANGDVANKIGTFTLAVLAAAHNIPFYVAAPASSFDLSINNGKLIPIEMRNEEEVLSFWNIKNNGTYNVYNPAFDITGSKYITAIITELGIIKKPFTKNISKLIQS